MKTMSCIRRGVLFALLFAMGCERPSSAQAPEAASPPAPETASVTDPTTLPRIAANAEAIAAMLRDRFGEDVARNIRVSVDDRTGGARVKLTGEVPNEKARQDIIREIEVRVEGLRVSDINLDIAGPTRMLAAFDAPVNDSNPLVFSPDLSLAVTREGDVYETATGRRINRLGNLDLPQVQSLAFSPDGKWLATGHFKGAVAVWEMPLGAMRRILIPPDLDPRVGTNRVFAIEFTPDGKSLVTICEQGGELMMWDLSTGQGKLVGTQLPNSSSSSATVYAMAVSPDGKLIATANDYEHEGVILWDVAGRKRQDTLKGELFYPRSLGWSNDGRYLAAARVGRPQPGTVLVWDMTTRQARPFSPENSAEVDAVAFSPDGRTLAVRYRDDGIALWDLVSGSKWVEINRDKVGTGQGLRFSPDGNCLATECSSLRPAGLRLWDVSQRPGGSGSAKLPAAHASVATRDDALAMSIESAIGSRDKRIVEWVKAEVRPDGSVRLTGRVASQHTKDNMGRSAAIHGLRGEIVAPGQRKIINDIEVTGNYGP